MDIHNPINGSNKDPYEEYRQRIAAREKDSQQKAAKANSALLSFAQFLFWVKKTLHFFFQQTSAVEGRNEELKEILIEFKIALEILMREDRSQDLSFLAHLSLCWNKLLEQKQRQKRKDVISLTLQQLIREIQSSPKDQDFTLGYYLSEYAGQKWTPFPFMELIQKIHLAHQTESQASNLTRWVALLDELIAHH